MWDDEDDWYWDDYDAEYTWKDFFEDITDCFKWFKILIYEANEKIVKKEANSKK